MVLDNDGQFNNGLGNFVSIRIKMVDIPLEIRARLATLNIVPEQPEFGNINTSQGGSIHIGYGHIANGSIPPYVIPGATLTTGTIIGQSGDTGNADGTHLDVSAFYVPDNPIESTTEHFNGWGENNPTVVQYFTNLEFDVDGYIVMYEIAANREAPPFGEPVVINPLVLWPSLQERTNCPFDGRNPEQ